MQGVTFRSIDRSFHSPSPCLHRGRLLDRLRTNGIVGLTPVLSLRKEGNGNVWRGGGLGE